MIIDHSDLLSTLFTSLCLSWAHQFSACTTNASSPVWGQVMDDYSVIGRSLFKKETNIQLFVGLKVQLSTGEQGIIDSAFGQSGKFKIHIPGKCSCIPAKCGRDRGPEHSQDSIARLTSD